LEPVDAEQPADDPFAARTPSRRELRAQEAPAAASAEAPTTEAAEPVILAEQHGDVHKPLQDRKSTRLNSSHVKTSYALFCVRKKQREPAPASATTNVTTARRLTKQSTEA